MNETERHEILQKFKDFFKDSLIESHKRNTEKLRDINEFQINPFLLYYLANYLEGNSNAKSLAKVLVYPRVLGTSINTSFGTLMQGQFITRVLGAYASNTDGLDIEFEDQTDGRRKYCQLKSGPNSINRDDVSTIKNHFKTIKNRARTNRGDVRISDLVFCLIYGEDDEKNSFIKELEQDYNVFIGKEFWHRFTGDIDFYKHLIITAGEVAREVDMKDVVNGVIDELSKKVEQRFKDLFD